MATKKMLAILASPKRQGNAAKMLDQAVLAAKNCGYEIHFIWLYEQNIATCKGCMHCKSAGSCCINDDIKPLETLFKTCDLIVMSSPTYFANVSAPAKNLFDRLVGTVMNDNDGPIPKPLLSSKQDYLLLTTCNTPFPFDRISGQSTGTLRAMNEFFHISGMHHIGNVIFAGTRGKSEVPPKILHKIERKVELCARKRK